MINLMVNHLPLRAALRHPSHQTAGYRLVLTHSNTKNLIFAAHLMWECIQGGREDLAHDLAGRGYSLVHFRDEDGADIWTQAVREATQDGKVDTQQLSQSFTSIQRMGLDINALNHQGRLVAHDPCMPLDALKTWHQAGGSLDAQDNDGNPVSHTLEMGDPRNPLSLLPSNLDRIAFYRAHDAHLHRNRAGETLIEARRRTQPELCRASPLLREILAGLEQDAPAARKPTR